MFILAPGASRTQALNNQLHQADKNPTDLGLLSPNFGVSIPDATGGPIYDNDGNKVLVPNISILPDNVSSKTIEDTNGISTYIVRKGDTLSEIAELFDVSINTIKWENNIGNTLKLGQELRILPVTGVTHTIAKGDSFSKIAKKYEVDVEDITIFNDIDEKKLSIGKELIIPNGVKVKTPKTTTTTKRSTLSKVINKISQTKASTGYYTRPTRGRFTSKFGPRIHPISRKRSYHYGIDFAGKEGAPIVAAASGTVISNNYCGRGYGICVEIQHNNGTKTRYAHTSKVFVAKGAQVKKGQKIANIGKTGNVTGAHLHFEIIKANGSRLNPNTIF